MAEIEKKEMAVEEMANVERKWFDAVKEGNIEIVRETLEAGFPVDTMDRNNDYGNTALMWAALNEDIEMIVLLLEWGAEINKRDLKGNTAFMYPDWKGNEEIISLFLENGANPYIKNNDGLSAWRTIQSSNINRKEDVRKPDTLYFYKYEQINKRNIKRELAFVCKKDTGE